MRGLSLHGLYSSVAATLLAAGVYAQWDGRTQAELRGGTTSMANLPRIIFDPPDNINELDALLLA